MSYRLSQLENKVKELEAGTNKDVLARLDAIEKKYEETIKTLKKLLNG